MADPDPAPIITVRNLTNRFGKTVVHKGLNLDVRRGEVLGVVGASGSGKSVLLRTIVGLQTPTDGKITVLGTDVLTAQGRDLRAVQNRWGVMFQDGALFSSLTVRENVARQSWLSGFAEHAPPAFVVQLHRVRAQRGAIQRGSQAKRIHHPHRIGRSAHRHGGAQTAGGRSLPL